MIGKKFLCIALIVLSTNLAYGNMKEDIAFLNELYRQERYDMALSESQKFLSNYPDSKYNKNICDKMAKLFFIKKEYKNSEKYFEMLLTNYKLKKSEKTEVYSYLYRINQLYGNIGKANEYMANFNTDKELYEKTLYESGVLLLNNGKNREAVKEFSNVVQLQGEYYEPAILYLAMGLYNNGQYGDSLKYLDFYNGLQSDTKDIPLLIYLYGSSYYKINDLNKAMAYFEKGIADYPKDSYSKKGKITLLEIYANRGEIDKALSMYSTLDSEENKKAGVRVLADYFLTKEEYKRAISFYDVYGENKPDSVRYTYAYAFYKLENYNKAIEEFSKIKTEKYLPDSRYYITVSNYNIKNYEKVVSYEKYLSGYESDSKKHTDLSVIFANSYYEMGNIEKSYEYYKMLYKDYPTEDNLYRVIVLETKLSPNKEREQNIETLFERYKTEFLTGNKENKCKKDVYLAVGNYYYKNNNTEKAENIYKEYMATESKRESLESEKKTEYYTETTDKWLEDAEIKADDKVLKTLKITDTHKFTMKMPEVTETPEAETTEAPEEAETTEAPEEAETTEAPEEAETTPEAEVTEAPEEAETTPEAEATATPELTETAE